jgi:predicted O-linked N-acetylglucosamine transferase (SPINDLY family)
LLRLSALPAAARVRQNADPRALRAAKRQNHMDSVSLALRLDAAREHHRLGSREFAESLIEEILVAAPRHGETLEWSGFLALEAGRHRDAVDRLARAIQCGRNSASTHLLLGRAYKAAGELDNAIESYRRAILKDVRLIDAHVSLGVALRAKGENEPAIRSYRKALALNPTSFEAHLNLANLAEAAGDYTLAVKHFEQAEQLRAVSAETHRQHGRALWDLRRKSEAADQIERALRRDPDHLDAYLNLGGMLHAMAQYDGALTYFTALIERLDAGLGHPQDAAARATLHREARLGVIEALAGASRLDEALLRIEAELRDAGDTFALLERLYWIAPYRFTSQADLVSLYRRYQRVVPKAEYEPFALRLRSEEPARLRIGYLSADFRQHSVAFFIEPVLEHHDRTKFAIVCYSSNQADDEVTERLRSHAEEWVDVKTLTNRALAERIAADQIDVLVDLSGRTQGGRPGAFAFRPACLQVSYLGYPTFTGFQQFDFRLTDPAIDPANTDHGLPYEQPLRLPRSMFCYRPPPGMPEPGGSGSPPDAVRFGSFNQAPKLSPDTLRAWAAILEQVPGSVLVLKAYAFDDPAARQRVRDALAALGIGDERLEILPPKTSKHDHFATYEKIDVALDTFPYSGATTTCEALWMGVPVVTFAGETHAQRMGVSLLGALGLDELVAHSEPDYVRVAVELAANASKRAELRQSLRQRFAQSSLRDEEGFTRSFESVLRGAWLERWTGLRAPVATAT